MTDTEQRAHDLAVAFAACVEEAVLNSIAQANAELGNAVRPINADPDVFVNAYKKAYDKAITVLGQ